MERSPTPEPEDSLLHDDWVSAVRAQGTWYVIRALNLEEHDLAPNYFGEAFIFTVEFGWENVRV